MSNFCFNFRSVFYCFDFFSAKYRKGNVPSGVQLFHFFFFFLFIFFFPGELSFVIKKQFYLPVHTHFSP